MGDIEFFEDVFDPKFCAFLLKDAKSQLASGDEFRTSNIEHWHSNMVRASEPVLLRDYGPEQSAFILSQLVSLTCGSSM
jgi:hypothetical protein